MKVHVMNKKLTNNQIKMCYSLKLFVESRFARAIVQKADADLNLNMKTRIIIGIDIMTQASQTIYKWCDSVKPLLITPAAEEPTQNSHLMEMLDEGIKKMNLAQTELGNSFLIFNVATGKLISLEYRFENELQANSKHLQTKTSQNIINDFKEKLTLTEKFYNDLKAKGSKMYRDIGELITQTDRINMNVPDTDENPEHGNQSTENLIAKCNEITKKTGNE